MGRQPRVKRFCRILQKRLLPHTRTREEAITLCQNSDKVQCSPPTPPGLRPPPPPPRGQGQCVAIAPKGGRQGPPSGDG